MKSASQKEVRIGGASGYWGDSQEAPRQLLEKGNVDYLVFDYLAEVTMSILVRAKQKSPDLGYARDFVDLVMKPLLPAIKAKGVKVVVNAGGVNIAACAEALRKVAADQGLSLKVGIVEGDDVLDQLPRLAAEGTREMFQDKPMPDSMISANAYLGAFPIAAALDAGAEVVITGRCVDSAVTLGPLIHEFGWQPTDFDRLAAGSLVGHIIECGAQATGGNFTDWKEVADGWDDMGYPIAVCRADGTFAITKPEGTGGRVSRLTVGEQILYEIGDPAAYILPDVVCDFTDVTLEETKPDWLEVAHAKGRAPTSTYKVSGTYRDGYRSTASTIITGFDAAAKGQAFMDSLIKRTRRLFVERNLGDYRGISSHLVGAETLWGQNAHPTARESREIMARLDVRHDEREALELFSKETTGVALSMTTGRCSAGAAGRPKITPVVAQFAFKIAKDRVHPKVSVNGEEVAFAALDPSLFQDDLIQSPVAADDAPDLSGPSKEVDLIELAVARSGDKGNNANVGVMARNKSYLPYIRAALDEAAVAGWFAHVLKGEVTRYDLPGMNALNFLLTDCLDGGGTSSLHLDNMGKTYGQQILAMKVRVPEGLL
ncbi:acyclic terpene utilization AtuA family protein [Sneathiella limimaris]|uniref:acyclic terpene utilization AtuA family protein n=1 Tax=Sneathiella limimaris TaxID=1964213 RepID=UPI00146B23E7|nr:acyclic terpene utilization AtuA family protein [Sneathiella limimaris]